MELSQEYIKKGSKIVLRCTKKGRLIMNKCAGKLEQYADGTGVLHIAEVEDFECDCGSKKAKILEIDYDKKIGTIQCKKCGKEIKMKAEKSNK